MTDLFTNHRRFADLDDWHAEADALRADGASTASIAATDGFPAFWAVLGLEEVLAVERQPALFTNEPLSCSPPTPRSRRRRQSGARIRSLVQMDAPDHPKYRRLTADWFKPGQPGPPPGPTRRAHRRRPSPASRPPTAPATSARTSPSGTRSPSSSPSSASPRTDYPRMLKLTQELFGATDEDLGRGGTEGLIETILDYFRYFGELTADRRAHPTDDLASLIANGKIDDHPLPDLELMSYYVIIAAAGHDTTSSAITGGLQALIEHPDQLDRLQAGPDADRQRRRRDDPLGLTGPPLHPHRAGRHQDRRHRRSPRATSSTCRTSPPNRDPRVFDDPHRFDVGRANADRHVAFGFGAHFCLGAQLARMEMRTLYRNLLPRLRVGRARRRRRVDEDHLRRRHQVPPDRVRPCPRLSVANPAERSACPHRRSRSSTPRTRPHAAEAATAAPNGHDGDPSGLARRPRRRRRPDRNSTTAEPVASMSATVHTGTGKTQPTLERSRATAPIDDRPGARVLTITGRGVDRGRATFSVPSGE